MKTCTKCNISKDEIDFSWQNKEKGYLKSQCKSCDSNYLSKYNKKNRIILNEKRNKRLENPEVRKKRDLRYKNWKNNNLEHYNNYQREYQFNREREDINFKLSRRLRHRLNQSLKNNYKNGSAVKDLGCSIEELKKHLESKFQPGMTWDSWGKFGWHIDHIIPLASANNSQELIKLCHYTNLQPLWAVDNLKKGCK